MIKVKIALLTLMCLGFVSWLEAAEPYWWSEYGLIDGRPRQDNAVATVGQAKHVVAISYQYLEAELMGGAGVAVESIYNDYCRVPPLDLSHDQVALTLGQLKFLAKPFYDRLNAAAEGLNTSSMNAASADIYPWTAFVGDDADSSLATIGQLKFVFSFNISAEIDSDGDGMIDPWELRYGLDPFDPTDAHLDLDGDRLTNLEESRIGTNPIRSVSLDGDTIPDDWEIFHGMDISSGVDSSDLDLEPDGANAATEFNWDLDPNFRDHPALQLQIF